MIGDATFVIHHICTCTWANFWPSYSVLLVCLASHVPIYTSLIAKALWHVLVSDKAYPHHTALLFKFSWLFLIVYYVVSTSESTYLTLGEAGNTLSIFNEDHVKWIYLPGPNGHFYGIKHIIIRGLSWKYRPC